MLDHATQLIEFCVGSYAGVSDTTLQALANHCPHLQVLDIEDCSDLTEEGVAAVVHACCDLISLIVGKDVIAEETLEGWKKAYPKLEIEVH